MSTSAPRLFPMNPDYQNLDAGPEGMQVSRLQNRPFKPTPLGLIVLLFYALSVVACKPSPPVTPSLVPIPTATYIATETPPAVESATPTVEPVRAVVTDTLRVRESPDLNAKIIARLKKDTSVLLYARKDDNQWYAIEWPPGSGEGAWISADIVVPEGPTDNLPIGFTSPPPPPGSIFGKTLFKIRFRSGPGTDYDTLDRIPSDARVTILARSDDNQWVQIVDPRDSSQRAWIALKDQEDSLVELLGDLAQVPVAPAPPTPTAAPTALPRPTRTPGPPGSSAGGRILMSSNRSGGYAIYTIGETGAIGRGLTPFGDAFGARWSPDGGRITFYHLVSSSPVATSHVFVMNADGSRLADLSASTGSASDTDPDWSPDGKSIVFVRTARAGPPEIWTMNLDGSGARRVISLSAATGASATSLGDLSPRPRWSPDGGRIAYSAVPRTRNPGAPLFPNIFVVRNDGSGETQLTDNDSINANPVWSSDGRQIAWSAKDLYNRQNWRVWAMSSGGGNQRMVIGNFSGDGNNGAQVVEWVGNRFLLAGWTGNWNAYVANADGSGIVPVTRDSADNRPTDWLP